MKSVWLIEGKLGESYIYWGHFADCRNWTPEPWEAVHFANERSAKDVLRFLTPESKDIWYVTEHGFEEWL